MNEDEFQGDIRATPWFREFTNKYGAEPNLNDPNYDYRKAMGAGYRPTMRDPGDQLLHWPSQFKGENHPNRFVDGIDTMTGRPSGRPLIPPQAPRSQVWGPPAYQEPAPEPTGRERVTSGEGWPVMGALAEDLAAGPTTGMWPTPRAAKPLEVLPDRRDPQMAALAETQLSPGLPVANRAAATAERLADRYIIPKTPSDYASMLAGGPIGKAAKTAILAAGNVLDPEEAQTGKMGSILKAAKGGGGRGNIIKAYHSSPHDFEKFDVGKIGTGEGAQVYGHGLYFAENPAVSGRGGEYYNQFMRRFSGPEEQAAQYLALDNFDRVKTIKTISDQLEKNRQFRRTNPYEFDATRQAQLEESLRLLESGKPVGPRTYEVNIHADPAHMLDWDKPLREQGKDILNRFSDAAMPGRKNDPVLRELFGEGAIPSEYLGLFDKSSGAQAYKTLAAEGKGAPAFSRQLAEAGIPGIKYLDEGSRAGTPMPNAHIQYVNGKYHLFDDFGGSIASADDLATAKAYKAGTIAPNPTRNIVVFDPERTKIEIMKKYGIAGAAAPMGALAATDNLTRGEDNGRVY